MLNTCSIGRRWKPREGWSRPVLTGERGTLFPILVGRVSSCGGFLVGWQGTLFLVVTTTILVRRLICLRPLSGSRTATIGIVAWFRFCRPILVVGRYIGFAVVMAQVRRPVPFRTRKLRPGRGDGTALERVWESSTPPHSFVGVPVERDAPGTPFSYSRTRAFSSAHWRFSDAGRTAGGMIPPPTGCFVPPGGPWAGGSLQSLGDPRNFRGASCPYPMVE